LKLGLIKIDEWPFGKHKGKSMKDIPTEYLTWVVYDSDIGGMPLKWAMEELDKREAMLVGGTPGAVPDGRPSTYGDLADDVW
jgi:hypothetical protein